MKPATRPRGPGDTARLMVLDAEKRRIQQHSMEELAELLEPGDLVVVNDAATIPGSLFAHTEGGHPVGVRLVRQLGPSRWQAVLFGEGCWRQPTEDLPPAPRLEKGHSLRMAGELRAELESVDPRSHRLVTLRFAAADEDVWHLIYAHGRPIQYSYLEDDLDLWDVQTAFASRPWAAEMPSASKLISPAVLRRLTERGIEWVSVTHAAGLSSTGEAELDALLPLPERYEIPAQTVAAIIRTKRRGGRVIAAGTSVVRALEGSADAHQGRLIAGSGVTDYLLSAHTPLRVVDGVLSGMHAPGESHYELLKAFASSDLLRRSGRLAVEGGFVAHEFGDACLILAPPTSARTALGPTRGLRSAWRALSARLPAALFTSGGAQRHDRQTSRPAGAVDCTEPRLGLRQPQTAGVAA